MKNWSWRHWGLFAGLLCLIVHAWAPATAIEWLYGRLVYPVVCTVMDHTLGRLPIAGTYWLLLLVVVLIGRTISRRHRFNWQWRGLLWSAIAGIGWLIAAFYLLWGFNYDRVGLSERVPWQVEPASSEALWQEGEGQVQRLAAFFADSAFDISKSPMYNRHRLMEAHIVSAAAALARHLGYQNRTRMRCRSLWPSGLLLRISTAGFYNPLTADGNIDPGLHPLQQPFVMAHEAFHGMGVTGEGDCNFLAYLLCHQSSNPLLQYSAELSYWRYIRRHLHRSDGDRYAALVARLPHQVVRDLEDIDETLRRYPDFAPRLRDTLYNAYLHSNKIRDGMANYGQIVHWVMSWRASGAQILKD